MQNQETINVTIIGGGTAGWMTAAAISVALPESRVRVTLIESDAIGIVGVGEATLPHLRRFNDNLGLDESEFMAATGATCKLGIEFVDWARRGDRYLHPFGAFGTAQGGIEFHHFWRRLAHDPSIGPIGDYSLPVVAAYNARFQKPDDADPLASSYGYAYHFDSARYGQLLRRYAEARGVTRHEGRVVAVHRHGSSGDIREVELSDGRRVGGDLFVDCSGFRALLIGDALGSAYDDWSDL
ncbi:MAG: tryptophan 7-halogenase, partial [Pseudomonadota bacterium]